MGASHDLKSANALDYYLFVFVCITILALKSLIKSILLSFFLSASCCWFHFLTFSIFYRLV
ncbi:hypothetical protein HMPREF1419_01344 [Helicobacter pylori GAM263BFi]|nr:hypothetical protein HMPREF1419_01344 [Helicobacter pylori GAM263BFi]